MSTSRYTSAAVCLLVIASCSGSGGVAPPEPRVSTATATVTPPDTDGNPPSPPATIPDIQRRYTDVRSRLQSFRRVEREINGLSTEGGTMEAFLDGDAPRLVKATFYGETGQSDSEFYYDNNGDPFFVFEREIRYEGQPLSAVARTREYRYYFHERQLIRLVDGERRVSVDDENYASRVKAKLELSDQLLKMARRPSK